MSLVDSYYITSCTKPTGWTHIVMNYLGPNDGEGVRIYIDGAEVASTSYRYDESRPAGDGKIVVGRYYTEGHTDLASVQVDELIYFNASLIDTDVQSIYNSVKGD